MKRKVSDAQFKNQVIFTIKGMQANIKKIQKMFPGILVMSTVHNLNNVIYQIKGHKGPIIRKPK